MTSPFILSLDCEGRWGIADHLTDEDRLALTDERLRMAYLSIIRLLDKYEIPATFAFVGGFTWSRETLDLKLLRDFAPSAPSYINPILAEIETEEGWLGEWAVDMVPAVHEIALHGATHVPWGTIDEKTARRELELLKQMPRVSQAQTYVFPRNQVRHANLLSAVGVKGWRDARGSSRLVNFCSEFNPLARSDLKQESLPAGRFVNWKHGVRRAIPVWLSRARARNLMKHAVKSGGTVHYWTHPENIATSPETLILLEHVLAEAAAFRDRGLIRPMTQIDYLTARS